MSKYPVTIVLLLIAIGAILFAFVKADEAAKGNQRAEMAQMEAERLRDELEVIQKEAEQATNEAQRQAEIARENHEIAEQAIRDCQNNN